MKTTKAKNLSDVLKRLKKSSAEIKLLKVQQLMIFGSFARGDQKSSSDIDVIVDFTENVGFFHFFDTKTFLESILGRPVDLVVKDAIRPEFKAQIEKEMVRAA